MKRLLPFVVTMLALLFPALASAQEEEPEKKGKVTITQVEHCTISVMWWDDDEWYGEPIESGAEVPYGLQLKVSAQPEDGYRLESFVVNGAETKPQPNNTLYPRPVVNGDITVTAKVSEIEMVPITIVNPEHGQIKVSRRVNGKLTAIKSGDVAGVGEGLTVEVFADDGYEIDHWLINSESKPKGSFNPSTLFYTVTGATTISAVMKKACALTLAVDPDEGGSFKAQKDDKWGSKLKLNTISANTKVYLTLIPEPEYSINHWVVDGVEQAANSDPEKQNILEFTMTKDMSVTAVLNKPAPREGDYLITMEREGEGKLRATDSDDKPVRSGDKVAKDLKITFKATPTDGYEVDKWFVNGKENTDNAGKETLELTITEATSVKVVFKKIIFYTVTFSAGENGTLDAYRNDASYGQISMSSGVQLREGTELKFIAHSKEDFLVDKWLINGKESTELGSDAEVTINLDANKEVKVLFKAAEGKTHKVNFSAGAAGIMTAKVEGSRITDGSYVVEGKEITFTAEAKAFGNVVDKWTVNSEAKAPTNNRKELKVTMGTEDIDVEVTFRSTVYVIFVAGDNGTIAAKAGKTEITSPAEVDCGKKVTFTATPDEGYMVEGWYKNGSDVADPALGTKTTIKEEILDDIIYLVKFKKYYTVTYEAGENGTLAATVKVGEESKALATGEKVLSGTVVTFTATPAEGYEVDQWKLNDEVVEDNANALEYRPEITADTKVTVSFKKKVNKFPVTIIEVKPVAEAGTITVTDDKGNEIKTGAKVAEGTILTITAEAKDKYEFESFTINKEVMGKDAKGVTKVIDKVKYTYKLEVKSSTVIGATFSKPTFADDILAQTKDFAVVDGSIYCPGASMIALYTMDGKLVRTIEAEVMEVRDLATGNYIVIATNREGVALRKKIVL